MKNILKEKLKELRQKMFKANDLLSATLSDDQLLNNLFRFQRYNPGLFKTQLDILLNRHTPLTIEQNTSDKIRGLVMSKLSFCNTNTSVMDAEEIYPTTETYEYSDESHYYNIPVKSLITCPLDKKILKMAYCAVNNILFIGFQRF